jgi:hypothetical protein
MYAMQATFYGSGNPLVENWVLGRHFPQEWQVLAFAQL